MTARLALAVLLACCAPLAASTLNIEAEGTIESLRSTFTWVPHGGPDDSIASWQVELFENGILVSTASLPAAQTSYIFSSVPGYSYRLETSTTLDAAWSEIGPVLEANAAVSLLEAPLDGPRRFFRVRVVGGPAE